MKLPTAVSPSIGRRDDLVETDRPHPLAQTVCDPLVERTVGNGVPGRRRPIGVEIGLDEVLATGTGTDDQRVGHDVFARLVIVTAADRVRLDRRREIVVVAAV
jgi:hypothetical protein